MAVVKHCFKRAAPCSIKRMYVYGGFRVTSCVFSLIGNLLPPNYNGVIILRTIINQQYSVVGFIAGLCLISLLKTDNCLVFELADI